MTIPKKPVKPPALTYQDKLSRMRKRASSLAEQAGMKQGFRSGLEFKIGKYLTDTSIAFDFETLKIRWIPLPIPHTYNPDFIITTASGKTLIIESKGRFMPDDMAKHLAVKAQHPEVEVLFVFQNAGLWFRKAKTRTYAKWCEENGFRYCTFNKDFKEKLKEWMDNAE